MNEISDRNRADGPDVLLAMAYGDSIRGIESDARNQALDLYGPDADLKVEEISQARTASCKIHGSFVATVKVRCVNFAALRAAAAER